MLAIGSGAAIKRFKLTPWYRREAIPVNVFKRMCENCNELMEQVGRMTGWDNPKESFLEHFSELQSISHSLCSCFHVVVLISVNRKSQNSKRDEKKTKGVEKVKSPRSPKWWAPCTRVPSDDEKCKGAKGCKGNGWSGWKLICIFLLHNVMNGKFPNRYTPV